jgi:SpoVK/Ycf46/Vps4 family AAA+-type ATPase
MHSFNEGDRVVLIAHPYMKSSSNPVWGEDGEYIAGIVTSAPGGSNWVTVSWDNKTSNTYEVTLDTVVLELYQDAPKPRKKVFGGGVELDSTHLDKLVIDPDTKAEIVALLQQHKHASKIFDDWGLGEVIEYGRGMTFMFWGTPGTGKTFGANCIAKALDKELLIISAAEIQSSEPGGANRAIQQAFSEAKAKKKILFLDECDSLIANRANLGMILSSEVNTLLTEIEKTEGVVILATNMIGNMDPALERRIQLIVEFPKPNEEQRRAIWKGLLPSKMPLNADVQIETLAEHDLTGGLIKNVVLQAARLAISDLADEVSLKHFTKAIERVKSSQGLMGKERIQHGPEAMVGGRGKFKAVDKKRVIDGLKKLGR